MLNTQKFIVQLIIKLCALVRCDYLQQSHPHDNLSVNFFNYIHYSYAKYLKEYHCHRTRRLIHSGNSIYPLCKVVSHCENISLPSSAAGEIGHTKSIPI